MYLFAFLPDKKAHCRKPLERVLVCSARQKEINVDHLCLWSSSKIALELLRTSATEKHYVSVLIYLAKYNSETNQERVSRNAIHICRICLVYPYDYNSMTVIFDQLYLLLNEQSDGRFCQQPLLLRLSSRQCLRHSSRPTAELTKAHVRAPVEMRL